MPHLPRRLPSTRGLRPSETNKPRFSHWLPRIRWTDGSSGTKQWTGTTKTSRSGVRRSRLSNASPTVVASGSQQRSRGWCTRRFPHVYPAIPRSRLRGCNQSFNMAPLRLPTQIVSGQQFESCMGTVSGNVDGHCRWSVFVPVYCRNEVHSEIQISVNLADNAGNANDF